MASCCGQPSRRRRKGPAPEPLPPNPVVRPGRRLLYLGEGAERIDHMPSGHTYHVGDHRRHLVAHVDDVPRLLTRRDFILAP
jgi:hypothetical protein